LKGGSGNGASVSLLELGYGEPGGGSYAKGPKGYERKALGMGISSWGLGQPGVGSLNGDFEMWLKGALEVECLFGSFVKGT